MTPHVKSDIPSYLNGDLAEGRRQQIEAHLAECASCRSVMNKTKAKLSRVKRQALKNAMPGRVPNLLVTRLGKQASVAQRPSNVPWGWIFVFIVLVAVAGWVFKRYRAAVFARTPTPILATSGASISTATAGGFEVQQSSTPIKTEGLTAASVSTLFREPDSVWQGSDSPVHEARQVVVRSRPAWRTLWSEMAQPGEPPQINFDDKIVVGIFGGAQSDSNTQVTLAAPRDRADDVLIPYNIARSTTTATSSSVAAIHPYAFKLIPRTPKRVRFSQEAP